MRATKVNAGLTESNGRLLLGLWRDSLHVTCGLTACTPGSAPGPTLGNEYGKTLPFTFLLYSSVIPTRRIAYADPTRTITLLTPISFCFIVLFFLRLRRYDRAAPRRVVINTCRKVRHGGGEATDRQTGAAHLVPRGRR